MSHAVDWRCRSGACRFTLGHVRDGVLRPVVPVEAVDGRGVARVACPGCGRARVWIPAAAGPAATEGPGTARLERGAAGGARPAE